MTVSLNFHCCANAKEATTGDVKSIVAFIVDLAVMILSAIVPDAHSNLISTSFVMRIYFHLQTYISTLITPTSRKPVVANEEWLLYILNIF